MAMAFRKVATRTHKQNNNVIPNTTNKTPKIRIATRKKK